MKKRSSGISLIKYLKGKNLAILGYGSQGRAQALNLRDSGIIPLIGLPSKSKSRRVAGSDGFAIITPKIAISKSDIIAVLIPDHVHGDLFDNLSSPKVLSGKALIFAHGLSIAFGLVRPPSDCDIIMVAPHGPGVRLREKYIRSEPFTSFLAVEQDFSGQASLTGRAYAVAIGCPEQSQFESTFRDEAVGDIFGEQAVLCGGLVGLIEAGFQTLTKKGLSEESAYLECVYQLDLLVNLVKEYGPAGMFERISKTAAFGSLKRKELLFDSHFRKKLEAIYKEIENGEFARSLIREHKRGMVNLQEMLGRSRGSPLQRTHDRLYGKPKGRSRGLGRRSLGGGRKGRRP